MVAGRILSRVEEASKIDTGIEVPISRGSTLQSYLIIVYTGLIEEESSGRDAFERSFL